MSERPNGRGEVRVFVVDDHPAFLRSVTAVIAATPGFVLVGTADTGPDALDALTDRSDVDLVLLDVHLPGMSGIEVAHRRAAQGGTERIVLMSTSDRADLPTELDRGAAGFLPKVQLSTASLCALWDDAG